MLPGYTVIVFWLFAFGFEIISSKNKNSALLSSDLTAFIIQQDLTYNTQFKAIQHQLEVANIRYVIYGDKVNKTLHDALEIVSNSSAIFAKYNDKEIEMSLFVMDKKNKHENGCQRTEGVKDHIFFIDVDDNNNFTLNDIYNCNENKYINNNNDISEWQTLNTFIDAIIFSIDDNMRKINNLNNEHQRKLLVYQDVVNFTQTAAVYLPNIPGSTRTGYASASYDNFIYMIGTKSFIEWDTRTDKVTVTDITDITASYPFGTTFSRYYSQTDDILYMINSGGDSILFMDLKTKQFTTNWKTIPVDVNANGCIASAHQYIFIIGGVNGAFNLGAKTGGYLDKTQIFNIKSLSWESHKPSLNTARGLLCCIANPSNYKVFAIGGMYAPSGGKIWLSSIEVLSFENLANNPKWKELDDSLLYKKNYNMLCTLSYDDTILVLAGNSRTNGHDEVELIDTVSGSVSTVGYLNGLRSVITVDDIAYAVVDWNASYLKVEFAYLSSPTNAAITWKIVRKWLESPIGILVTGIVGCVIIVTIVGLLYWKYKKGKKRGTFRGKFTEITTRIKGKK